MKDYETERRASDRESCMYDASIVRGLLFDAIGALHGRYSIDSKGKCTHTVSSITSAISITCSLIMELKNIFYMNISYVRTSI